MQSNVAVKFPAFEETNADQIARFEDEVRSHVTFSNRHPNIVSILDVGRFGKRPYVVMQYLSNGCLDKQISSRGTGHRARLFDSARWLAGIADALDFIHQNNLLHRDVKPANILLDESMGAYLADFGIAMSQDSQINAQDKQLLVGSLPYMAPELLDGARYSPRSDQYALGVTIYEFLTLQRPFEAEDARELFAMHRNAAIMPPSQHLTGIPQRIDTVLLKSLALDPEQRYTSCCELARAIESDWELIAALLTNRLGNETQKKTRINIPIPNSATPPNGDEPTSVAAKRKIRMSRIMRDKP